MNELEIRRIKARDYRARRKECQGPTKYPVEAAQARIRELRAQGMLLADICREAEIPRCALDRMIAGHPYRAVYQATMERLEAVQPYRSGRTLVSAGICHRMIRALIAQGWTMLAIDKERGLVKNSTQRALYERQVQLRTQEEIYRWYEKLCGGPPKPHTPAERAVQERAKRMARERGWAPPHAWDDILDPSEKPKGWRRDGE